MAFLLIKNEYIETQLDYDNHPPETKHLNNF